MTRTLQTLLDEVREALVDAGLTELEWTLAEVHSVWRTRSGLHVGDLGWDCQTIRFAAVDRSLDHRLAHHGASWEPGLFGVFWIRLVVHPRFGFQAEIHDIDVAIVPIGGHYTMDRHDAVRAVEFLGVKTIIPGHYNTFPLIETDAGAFKSDVESKTDSQVVVLGVGETHSVGAPATA